MLSNLKKALRRKNITLSAYAAILGVSQRTVGHKLAGRTEFTLSEIVTTMDHLLPEYTLRYLFAADGDLLPPPARDEGDRTPARRKGKTAPASED